jgi:hypothetical protein
MTVTSTNSPIISAMDNGSVIAGLRIGARGPTPPYLGQDSGPGEAFRACWTQGSNVLWSNEMTVARDYGANVQIIPIVLNFWDQVVPNMDQIYRPANWFPARATDLGLPNPNGYRGGTRAVQEGTMPIVNPVGVGDSATLPLTTGVPWIFSYNTLGIKITNAPHPSVQCNNAIGFTQSLYCSPIWRRDFQNAIVFTRSFAGGPDSISSYMDIDIPTDPITIDGTVGSDGQAAPNGTCATPPCQYYPLLVDGTTAVGTTTVRLRAGEGAIMMKTPMAPFIAPNTLGPLFANQPLRFPKFSAKISPGSTPADCGPSPSWSAPGLAAFSNPTVPLALDSNGILKGIVGPTAGVYQLTISYGTCSVSMPVQVLAVPTGGTFTPTTLGPFQVGHAVNVALTAQLGNNGYGGNCGVQSTGNFMPVWSSWGMPPGVTVPTTAYYGTNSVTGTPTTPGVYHTVIGFAACFNYYDITVNP